MRAKIRPSSIVMRLLLLLFMWQQLTCDRGCSARSWLTVHRDGIEIIEHEGAGVAKKYKKSLTMRKLRWHIYIWGLASCGIEYSASADTFQRSI